jgi:hypothetical protein
MLQNISVCFQWLTLTAGDSTQHTCDMDERISVDIDDLGGRVEHVAIMLERVLNVLSSSQLPLSTKEMNWAAMRLVWLWCELPSIVVHSKTQVTSRGRPPKVFATKAASILRNAVEKSTRSDTTKPVSRRNKKPRGFEPLVRDIFNVCNFDADPKNAIARAEEQLPEPPENLTRAPIGRRVTAQSISAAAIKKILSRRCLT